MLAQIMKHPPSLHDFQPLHILTLDLDENPATLVSFRDIETLLRFSLTVQVLQFIPKRHQLELQ